MRKEGREKKDEKTIKERKEEKGKTIISNF